MSDLHHRLLFAHDHALINPLQVEAALWSDIPATLLMPEKVKTRTELMPRLVTLRNISDATCADLLERAQEHERYSRHPFFSALLETPADTVTVAIHLSRRMVIHTPGGGRALLRYFDPRVFRHLKWVLTDAEMNLLMGPITRWSWRNTAGAWQQYTCVETPPALSALRLTSRQWGSLQRLGLLNKSLRQIACNTPDIALDEGAAKRVDALLREAYEQHQITDESDRRLYAEQGIRYHPHIHRHAELVERLARTREGQTSYVGACGDLDATRLQRFAVELEQQQGRC